MKPLKKKFTGALKLKIPDMLFSKRTKVNEPRISNLLNAIYEAYQNKTLSWYMQSSNTGFSVIEFQLLIILVNNYNLF
jgi:hypothetical protein